MILLIIDVAFDESLYFDPQYQSDLPISLATDLYLQNTYSSSNERVMSFDTPISPMSNALILLIVRSHMFWTRFHWWFRFIHFCISKCTMRSHDLLYNDEETPSNTTIQTFFEQMSFLPSESLLRLIPRFLDYLVVTLHVMTSTMSI